MVPVRGLRINDRDLVTIRRRANHFRFFVVPGALGNSRRVVLTSVFAGSGSEMLAEGLRQRRPRREAGFIRDC